ncbi:MAG: hypothetical protein RLZZ23_1254 [Verrucomicrobiota bacterium]|jgi:hypothetical protein
MRNKNLLIVTLVLGLIAFAAVRLTREAPKTEAGKQPLVAAALLEGAKSLTIKANNKSVTVEKSADGWTVKEKLSLPADVENRLLPLIRGLQKANNFGQLTANPKRLEKLGLADASLTLVGPDGKPTTIQFGKQTEDGLGASARLAGQEFAVRTDFTGYLEGDPLSWVDLTLFITPPAEIKSISFIWKDGQAEFARQAKGALFDGKEGPAVEDIVMTLATVRAADAVALDDKDVAKAVRSSQVKLTLFDGTVATLTFANLAGTAPTDPGKTFLRVEHSDPKHKANATAKLAAFVAAPWLAEQVPGSLADFKKAQQAPAAEGAPSTIQIPGPAPTIITSPEIKIK